MRQKAPKWNIKLKQPITIVRRFCFFFFINYIQGEEEENDDEKHTPTSTHNHSIRRRLAGGSRIASSVYKMLSKYPLKSLSSSWSQGCMITSSILGRFAGFTVSICLISCFAISGTKLNCGFLKLNLPVLMNVCASMLPSFVNGKHPLSIAYKTTPKLHISTLEVYVPLPAVIRISGKKKKKMFVSYKLCWMYHTRPPG